MSDLTDATIFGDVGIDSLLGLTISARLKEELDVDLDFNSFSYDYPTVGSLKVFLGGDCTTSSSTKSSTSRTESTTSGAGHNTPATPVYTHESTELHVGLNTSKLQIQRAIEIISEESGIAKEDLTDSSDFADCGIDSLLSLVIVSRFRDELGLDIQHESLFLECPTVRDLKQMLGSDDDRAVQDQDLINLDEQAYIPLPDDGMVDVTIKKASPRTSTAEGPASSPVALRKAVDEFVEKYTTGFHATAASVSTLRAVPAPYDDMAKVVLVTGGTGSLGGHLAYQLARRADVQTVVCLNRKHKMNAFERQKKAMKDKGVHFPDHLLGKLQVVQTDASKPNLGLPKDEFDNLASVVTHIIHQAWPMSVKRPLSDFEPQFATMRHLLDLANAAAIARRQEHSTTTTTGPESFRFGFLFISSISVVGNYTADSRVPEGPVDIDALLPIGYAQAKWGCERMLDATVHAEQPGRAHFRATTARLGQIAGSSVSGYWNPMEHFGFLVKSSKTLGALPAAPPGALAHWTPVDAVAGVLVDLSLPAEGPHAPCHRFYHVENPIGKPWEEINRILIDALKLAPQTGLIPLKEWTRRIRAAPQHGNPALALVDFLEGNYERLSCGGLVLDPTNTIEHSPTLAAVGPVSEEIVRKYVHVWKEIGFLDN